MLTIIKEIAVGGVIWGDDLYWDSVRREQDVKQIRIFMDVGRFANERNLLQTGYFSLLEVPDDEWDMNAIFGDQFTPYMMGKGITSDYWYMKKPDPELERARDLDGDDARGHRGIEAHRADAGVLYKDDYRGENLLKRKAEFEAMVDPDSSIKLRRKRAQEASSPPTSLPTNIVLKNPLPEESRIDFATPLPPELTTATEDDASFISDSDASTSTRVGSDLSSSSDSSSTTNRSNSGAWSRNEDIQMSAQLYLNHSGHRRANSFRENDNTSNELVLQLDPETEGTVTDRSNQMAEEVLSVPPGSRHTVFTTPTRDGTSYEVSIWTNEETNYFNNCCEWGYICDGVWCNPKNKSRGGSSFSKYLRTLLHILAFGGSIPWVAFALATSIQGVPWTPLTVGYGYFIAIWCFIGPLSECIGYSSAKRSIEETQDNTSARNNNVTREDDNDTSVLPTINQVHTDTIVNANDPTPLSPLSQRMERRLQSVDSSGTTFETHEQNRPLYNFYANDLNRWIMESYARSRADSSWYIQTTLGMLEHERLRRMWHQRERFSRESEIMDNGGGIGGGDGDMVEISLENRLAEM